MHMQQLDKELDSSPTEEKVIELAETRIRNLQAIRELESYNTTGKFLNKHTLLNAYSLKTQLEQLLANNPAKFLEQYANTRENVKRYKSRLNSSKRNNKRDTDEQNLRKHEEREMLMKEVLGNSNS